MSRDRALLAHILQAIEKIERYTSEGKQRFLVDELIQDAVLRNLHTLAESTQRVSDPLRAANPSVDWAGIAGFRNVVVHDYLGIDLQEVWGIVERDLPPLKREMQKIAETLKP